MDFKTFVKDDKTVGAIIRKIENIVEAVKQLLNDVRDRFLDILWASTVKKKKVNKKT